MHSIHRAMSRIALYIRVQRNRKATDRQRQLESYEFEVEEWLPFLVTPIGSLLILPKLSCSDNTHLRYPVF